MVTCEGADGGATKANWCREFIQKYNLSSYGLSGTTGRLGNYLITWRPLAAVSIFSEMLAVMIERHSRV